MGLIDDGTDGLTSKIIGAAINVHRRFGPGLYESAYERCVGAELRHMGLRVGLLFNFNVDALAAGGFRRVLNDE